MQCSLGPGRRMMRWISRRSPGARGAEGHPDRGLEVVDVDRGELGGAVDASAVFAGTLGTLERQPLSSWVGNNAASNDAASASRARERTSRGCRGRGGPALALMHDALDVDALVLVREPGDIRHGLGHTRGLARLHDLIREREHERASPRVPRCARGTRAGVRGRWRRRRSTGCDAARRPQGRGRQPPRAPAVRWGVPVHEARRSRPLATARSSTSAAGVQPVGRA